MIIADKLAPQSGLCETWPAGETLSGHRAVILDGGELFYADKDDLNHLHIVRGVTTRASLAGAEGHITVYGWLAEAGWNWTPGLPIYVGNNGVLTQTPPTTGFRLIIAVAYNATTIFINPKEPIKKAG